MKTTESMSVKNISPRAAFFSIVILLALMAGTVALVFKMLNGGGNSGADGSPRKPGIAQRKDDAQVDASIAAGDDYSIIVKRNLFQAAAPKLTAALSVVGKPTDPPVFSFTTTPVMNSTPVVPTNAGPHLAYTGMVELPDGAYALLENLDSQQSQYVKIGEAAFGYKVVEATTLTVTLEQHGDRTMLNLGANKKEDLGLTATPPPPTPENGGQPGATPAPNGQPGNVNISPIPAMPGGGSRFPGRQGRRNAN